jgi:hypothetical protein
MQTIEPNATVHALHALNTGKMLYLAATFQDLMRHLGKLPKTYGLRTRYSLEPVTYEMGEQFATLPGYEHITAVINLL